MTRPLSIILPYVFRHHLHLEMSDENAAGASACCASDLVVAIIAGDTKAALAIHATLGILLEPDLFADREPEPWSPDENCLHGGKCFNADPWACHKDSRQFNGKGRRPWRCSCAFCHGAFVAQKHREQAAERRRRIKAQSAPTW
jgi:hypothetical protein